MATSQEFDFTSLGGVWLDELRWPGKAPLVDVVGGSATYSSLGARMFARVKPAQICMIIQAGHDFPVDVLRQLERWEMTLHVIRHEDSASTRGILEHTNVPGHALFTRLTPPLLTSPEDLIYLNGLDSRFIHVFGTAEIASTQCSQLSRYRETAGLHNVHRAQIIWEPHPKSCTQELLADHIDVLRCGGITVFSPNHFELASFFSGDPAQPSFDREKIETHAKYIWASAEVRKRTGHALQAIIIRAAEHGCLLLTQQNREATWLPAFWSSEQQDHVIDPTGAGNAFLGALAQGFAETGSWLHAASYATVAASIVVEHVGVPILEVSSDAESWSGSNARQRLAEYLARSEIQELLQGSQRVI